MFKLSLPALFALVLGSSTAWGCNSNPPAQAQKLDIGYVEVDQDITLRRMVVHTASPKGTVLLLHGFPETLCAWKNIVPGAVHGLRSPCHRLAGLRSFIETPGRQVFLLAQRLCPCSAGVHQEGEHCYIEPHDLRNGYRSPPGSSCGSRRSADRQDHHCWRLRAVQQAPVHARQIAKSEVGTFGSCDARRLQKQDRCGKFSIPP